MLAAYAYRVSFGVSIVLLCASVVMGVVAAQRDAELPILTSADAIRVDRVPHAKSVSDAWLEQMRNFAAIQPRSISAWRALCISHRRREEPVEAIVACRRAIGLGDPSGIADRALARVYLDVGRDRKARHHARRASELGLPLGPKLRPLVEPPESS